jgi:Pyruvate/2-oxoacid:ferredoxin oxidoreductase gamma subunit
MISIVITAVLFSYWLYKKLAKPRTFQFPIDIQTGDIIHGAFGSLLANLSMQGYLFDVMVGVLLYLTYQFTEFAVKQDTIYKDIATFTAGYFATIVSKYIPL